MELMAEIPGIGSIYSQPKITKIIPITSVNCTAKNKAHRGIELVLGFNARPAAKWPVIMSIPLIFLRGVIGYAANQDILSRMLGFSFDALVAMDMFAQNKGAIMRTLIAANWKMNGKLDWAAKPLAFEALFPCKQRLSLDVLI